MTDNIYYIFYTNKNKVYAFTNDKSLVKKFMKLREDKFFKLKKYKFNTTEEEFDFCKDYGYKRIQDFYFDKIDKNLYLTNEEIISIEAYPIKSGITMSKCSVITPNIFNKEIFKALYNLRYIEYWRHWYYGSDINYDTQDYFDIFILLYQETINFKKLKKEIY